MCKNNSYIVGEIDLKINELRKDANKKNVAIVNKLTGLKHKTTLTPKDLAFLESVDVYVQ